LRTAFEEAGGHEIDTQGDSFFVAFRRARDAVSAAAAAQRSLADQDRPDGIRVRVRMGIHTGEPVVATTLRGAYPAPSEFSVPLISCGSFNFARFCNAKIDAAIRRAFTVQTSDPRAANELWARVDRDLVNQAPHVPLTNPRGIDLVSPRVGNYQYNPQWGALIDQLWVR
jgi:ABC-type transport system substrate-binding protein